MVQVQARLRAAQACGGAVGCSIRVRVGETERSGTCATNMERALDSVTHAVLKSPSRPAGGQDTAKVLR